MLGHSSQHNKQQGSTPQMCVGHRIAANWCCRTLRSVAVVGTNTHRTPLQRSEKALHGYMPHKTWPPSECGAIVESSSAVSIV
eukprot:5386484-Amphidinium_carterae.2